MSTFCYQNGFKCYVNFVLKCKICFYYVRYMNTFCYYNDLNCC